MSDDVTAAIETSIAGLEGSDATPEDSGAGTGLEATSSTPVVPDASGSAIPPVTETPAVPVPPVDPATIKLPDDGEPKRAKYMPMDRHDRVIAATREEHAKAVQTIQQQHQQELQTYQTRASLLDVADQDPQRFLTALAQADPRYAQLLQGFTQSRNGNGHAPPDPNAEMPEPDAQFADGSVGYSPAGLKKLLEWNAGSVESRIAQRYKAIEDAHLADQQLRGAVGRVSQKVQGAMQWEGFAENQNEIAQALKADRNLTLETAYMKVMSGKWKADRTTMRQQLLAEINGKPHQVTGTTPAGGVPPAVLSDDLVSVIQASIANLPR